MKAIAVVSGGMDSVTMAYHLRSEGYDLHVVSFDYGQRHKKELECAFHAALNLGSSFDQVDITSIQALLGGSALTDRRVQVPHGHYAAESMKATVVPNRNAIMLSIAWGIMVAEQGDVVATAVHAGDHAIYPDCRPAFIDDMTDALRTATEGFRSANATILAPFVLKSKTEIVTIGDALGVPFKDTWSCYEGGDRHCGQCGTCAERREAFFLAGVPDPTEYVEEDNATA